MGIRAEWHCLNAVIPAKAGIQFQIASKKLDPSLRWDDEIGRLAGYVSAIRVRMHQLWAQSIVEIERRTHRLHQAG